MQGEQQGSTAVADAPGGQGREAGHPADRQRGAELAALPVATVVVEADGRIVAASGTWADRMAAGPAAAADDAATADDHAAISAGIRRLLAPHRRPGGPEGPEGSEGERFHHDYRWRARGHAERFRLQVARVEDPPRAVVVVHTPLPEPVRPARKVAGRTRQDDLTELPNRSAMLELVGEALAEAVDGGPGTALLFLGLHGFKTVNDSLGHEVGDALLREAGNRLLEQVRPGDAVGRLGGDRFVVLARGCDTAEAAALAFRLQTRFNRVFPAAVLSVPLSVSIGVAVGRDGNRSAHGLLRDADAAMSAAKAAGRDEIPEQVRRIEAAGGDLCSRGAESPAR